MNRGKASCAFLYEATPVRSVQIPGKVQRIVRSEGGLKNAEGEPAATTAQDSCAVSRCRHSRWNFLGSGRRWRIEIRSMVDVFWANSSRIIGPSNFFDMHSV